MKSKDLVFGIGVIAIIAILVAVYFNNENHKNENKIKELEEDKLKLILDSLNRNKELSEEIRQQIQKLIKQFKKLDTKVSNELVQALQLIQIGQNENAIEDLVKIIEHLLTKHYKDDHKCKEWLKEQKKKFDLHNLLTFCKFENKITDIEYQFYVAIKTIRNKEDHTLDLKLDKYLNESGIITAIGGIIKIASIVYPKKSVRTVNQTA